LLHLQVGCVIHPPMENAYDLDFIVCYLTIKNDMRANILLPITSFNVATVSALGRVLCERAKAFVYQGQIFVSLNLSPMFFGVTPNFEYVSNGFIRKRK